MASLTIVLPSKQMNNTRVFDARCLMDYAGGDTYGEIANRLNTRGGTVGRWVKMNQHFTELEADRWAHKLRAHPAEIWPNWWSDVPV